MKASTADSSCQNKYTENVKTQRTYLDEFFNQNEKWNFECSDASLYGRCSAFCDYYYSASFPYWDCVRATWDPIGCALNSDYEEWGRVMRDPKLGNPDERTFKRAEAMMDAGAFKNYSDLGSKALSGAFRQTCNLNKLLDLIEEKKDVSAVGDACYSPVRSGGAAGKVSLPNLNKR